MTGEPDDEQKHQLSGLLGDLSKHASAAMRTVVAAERASLSTQDEKEMMEMNLTKLKQTCEESEEVFHE